MCMIFNYFHLQSNAYLNFKDYKISWFVYTLDESGPQLDTFEDEKDASINLATHLVLPSADLFNLWENLIYDSHIKYHV